MSVSADVERAIAAVNNRFCEEVLGRRNFAVVDESYTRNARVLPPDSAMVEGRQAIRQFWEWAVPGIGVKSGTLSTLSLESCGDSVVEIGRAKLSLENGQAVDIKYLVHWKQEDGSWRWDKDIWNVG